MKKLLGTFLISLLALTLTVLDKVLKLKKIIKEFKMVDDIDISPNPSYGSSADFMSIYENFCMEFENFMLNHPVPSLLNRIKSLEAENKSLREFKETLNERVLVKAMKNKRIKELNTTVNSMVVSHHKDKNDASSLLVALARLITILPVSKLRIAWLGILEPHVVGVLKENLSLELYLDIFHKEKIKRKKRKKLT